MNWLQRLVIGVVPRSWGEAIEAESRTWIVRCSQCGHERSLWDLGGMRWKSTKPTQHYRVRCPQCQQRGRHTLGRAGGLPRRSAVPGPRMRQAPARGQAS